jgi:hypothetical protein
LDERRGHTMLVILVLVAVVAYASWKLLPIAARRRA